VIIDAVRPDRPIRIGAYEYPLEARARIDHGGFFSTRCDGGEVGSQVV
jgi:hypothetical protein